MSTKHPAPAPTNFVDERTMREIADGKPVRTLLRPELAARLGVDKDRLTLTTVTVGDRLDVSVLLDGGDLTPEQARIFVAWLQEQGLAVSEWQLRSERPTTS